jgi:hypothetical protein
MTYILCIQLLWDDFQEKETEQLNVIEGAESSTCVAGVEYWNEISIALNCRNAGVVFPLDLLYMVTTGPAPTGLWLIRTALLLGDVLSDSERRASLLQKN